MNTFKIEIIERKTITVNAANALEAEAIAFDSDAWTHEVDGYVVSLVETDDPVEIYNTFEKDFNDE